MLIRACLALEFGMDPNCLLSILASTTKERQLVFKAYIDTQTQLLNQPIERLRMTSQPPCWCSNSK
jgi:hypothetical protein